FNGRRYLRESLGSVLDQTDVDLELVVVNDGSTDGSALTLDDLARSDARVRVLHQENQGLTPALVRGCAEARGPLIARHDADDVPLPGRRPKQRALPVSAPGLVMASCWSRAVGPADELLFETTRPLSPAEATRSLAEEGVGPCHGSVMFRACAYRQVGGYRS